jgi:TolB-like protein/lipoprotein NlpI
LAGTDEQRDSEGVSSAGVPGPLSRLLRELAEAPPEELLEGWKRELRPGDRVGRFEIRREAGRGGFGAVYEAFDTELNRVVAVKTLRLSRPRHDLSSDWLKKEAEAVARLDHACIVTLFDVGTDDSGPYLVMEFLRGETLAQRIADGSIPQIEALRIAEEMAKGLAHAHQRGVLHRDLKPANVFVSEDGRVKLLDFGLAHLLGRLEDKGAGTPSYMAPEQARGDEIDERADVYAAGKILGEVLGDRSPRRLTQAVASATSADPAGRPRDGQAWLELLQAARRSVERPARVRRSALLAGAGVILGSAVAGLVVHRYSRPPDVAQGVATPSIAVLPFVDMSPQKDQEYLADGIAEQILDALAKVQGLRVPGRASSFYFKGKGAKLSEIGRELNVQSVLDGSVRRSGSRVRVTASVVDVADGHHVWSETYDRELSDVFEIQDDIAKAAVAAVKVTLLSRSGSAPRTYRTASSEAFASYLRARRSVRTRTIASVRRAIESAEKATRLDPEFAPAWAVLADAHHHHGVLEGSRWIESLQAARIAIDRGAALAPDLPEVLATRAKLRLFEWNWKGALEDIEKTLSLDPEDSIALGAKAYLTWADGRSLAAIQLFRRALEIDPFNGIVWNDLGITHAGNGQYDLARDALERALDIEPGNAFFAGNLAWVLLEEGKTDEALAACQKAALPPCVAIAQFLRGDLVQSQRALDEVIDSARFDASRTFWVACVQAWRGERDAAFDWLERAYDAHARNFLHLKTYHCWRKIRGDPRFAELLRKVNLPVD